MALAWLRPIAIGYATIMQPYFDLALALADERLSDALLAKFARQGVTANPAATLVFVNSAEAACTALGLRLFLCRNEGKCGVSAGGAFPGSLKAARIAGKDDVVALILR